LTIIITSNITIIMLKVIENRERDYVRRLAVKAVWLLRYQQRVVPRVIMMMRFCLTHILK
jgi:hypothetical protein